MKKTVQHHFGWVLLPVYFILHGWQHYAEILSLRDVAEAGAIIITVICLVWAFSYLLVKTNGKRSLLTLIAGFFLLFTTPVMNAVNGWRFLPKLEQQIIVILIILFLFVLLFRFVKTIHPGINQFINTILTLLILISIVQLVINLICRPKSGQLQETGFLKQEQLLKKRLSVYLILLDEYAGNETLLSDFKFSNDSFINFLQSRKFKVIKSASSNYSYTLLSVPSMFNGSFIKTDSSVSVYGEEGSKNGLLTMYHNHSFRLFKANAYIIKNYSPFVVQGYSAAYNNRFLPGGRLLLLYPSLLDDFYEQIPDYFLVRFGSRNLIRRYHQQKSSYQQQLMDNVLQDAKEIKEQPLFCYLHLMHPHAPYVWDSTGEINTDYLSVRAPSSKEQQKAYLEQLRYTNKKISAFTDSLLQITKGGSVIMIMSDHGYKSSISGDAKNKFNSLNAIYFPGPDSLKWYDGMSNINQFRNLFSMLSDQQLPLQKDSLVTR